MAPGAALNGYDRVAERRRAVALARHFREAEGLSLRPDPERLGRSPATIKAYFYDPTGEKARAVKARYVGVCRGCGAYTQPRNGKGDAYAYCKRCHPGAIERRWTRERVLDGDARLAGRYGRLPSSYDWSRTHARRRGGEALERLAAGEWPAASVVTRLFGTWAPLARWPRGAGVGRWRRPSSTRSFGSKSSAAQTPGIGCKIQGYERRRAQDRIQPICRAFLRVPAVSPISRVGEVPVQIRAPRFANASVTPGV